MRIDVVTIFPQLFESVFTKGIISKALEEKRLEFRFHNLRDYTEDKHQTVDDPPFGGGGGLIFKIEPLVKALRQISDSCLKSRSVLLSPRGALFSNAKAQALAAYEQVILFCGRYEGVDDRFSEYVDEEISIGDYILSGGEIPAMVLMDSISRFIPGVVGEEEAPYQDSFSQGLLEHPSYTRPRVFEGKSVPDILLTGHHEKISDWRNKASLNITLQKRPDLLQDSKPQGNQDHDREKS